MKFNGLSKVEIFALSFVTALTLLGCSKDKDAATFGPETSLEEISEAQSKALDSADPRLIQKGQFVYFLTTQEVFSSQQPSTSLLEEEGFTVVDRENQDGYFILTAIKEIIDHKQSDKPHYKFLETFYVEDADVTAQEKSLVLNPLAEEEDEEEPQGTVTFHNLVVRKEMLPKPSKVLEREPCPEGQDCRIEVTIINYDIINNVPGESAKKFSMELWMSSQVPYFASILKNCASTVIEIDDARPLVRECKSVYDYQFLAADEPVVGASRQ